jgi:hypothetical protein
MDVVVVGAAPLGLSSSSTPPPIFDDDDNGVTTSDILPATDGARDDRSSSSVIVSIRPNSERITPLTDDIDISMGANDASLLLLPLLNNNPLLDDNPARASVGVVGVFTTPTAPADCDVAANTAEALLLLITRFFAPRGASFS